MSTEAFKNTLDVTVVTTGLATVMVELPQIVLILTALYTVMRIVIEFPKLITRVKGWFK